MTAPESAGPWATLRGYRFRLGGFTIAAALAAYFNADAQTPSYEATALAQLISGRQLSGEFVSSEELRQLTSITAELARTRLVAEAAAEELGVSTSRLARAVDVTPREQLQVLTFRASSRDPEEAAAFADAYAEAVVDYLDRQDREQRAAALGRIQERVDEIRAELDSRGLELGDPGAIAFEGELEALQTSAADLQIRASDTARVIQPAVAPSEPASPKPVRDGVLAGIAALVLGVFAVLVRARFSDRYANADEAAADLGLQVIGELPRQATSDPATVEAVRSMRTSVAFMLRDEAHPVVLLTSAAPGAGKTHVSAVLARAFAAEGNHVVAVDGDLRRPALHERLGASLQPGIGDLVAGDLGATDSLTVQSARVDASIAGRGGRLEVVTAGRHVPDPAEALASDKMRQALKALVQAYDVIILDSPPALAVVDPVVLARYAHGVLLVIDARKHKRSEVRRALQTLRAVEAEVLGLVFNSSDRIRQRYKYYGRAAAKPERAARRR